MNVHFSSKTPEWATPQDFFDKLNAEFRFNLDPCATKENAKCKNFFTEKDDGLPGGLVRPDGSRDAETRPRPKGWRNAALKAAGNAIVPQVVYQIMLVIKHASQNVPE